MNIAPPPPEVASREIVEDCPLERGLAWRSVDVEAILEE